MNMSLLLKMLAKKAKRNDSEGFTLIELLAVVIILGVLVAMVLPRLISGGSGKAQISAEEYLRNRIDFNPEKPFVAECVNFDSDGDGYISCDLQYYSKDTGQVKQEKVLCGWSWITGCKKPSLGNRSPGWLQVLGRAISGIIST